MPRHGRRTQPYQASTETTLTVRRFFGPFTVTSELGYERSGPERFLSTFPLLAALLSAESPGAEVGRALARTAALHQLSSAVAGGLSRGESVDMAAAITKVLGTTHEGDVAELGGTMVGDTATDERLARLAATALAQRPGFTIRGGTNEILRGVIARGWGLRG